MHVNTLLAFVKYADTWYEPCRKDLICPLKAELFYIYCIESNIPLLVPSGRKTHAGNPFWSPDWQFKSHCSPKHEVNQTAVSEVTSCSSWRFIVVDDTIPESMKSDYRAVTKKNNTTFIRFMKHCEQKVRSTQTIKYFMYEASRSAWWFYSCVWTYEWISGERNIQTIADSLTLKWTAVWAPVLLCVLTFSARKKNILLKWIDCKDWLCLIWYL